MYIPRRHWLDYDPVALAALVIGIGIIELVCTENSDTGVVVMQSTEESM